MENFKTSYKNLKVANILKQVGDEGVYQKYIVVTMSLIGFFYGFVMYSIPYFFYEPDFLCEQENGTFVPCSQKDACNNVLGYKFETGWIWVEDYGWFGSIG